MSNSGSYQRDGNEAAKGLGGVDREFLEQLDSAGLRRALYLLRRQEAFPHEANPAAAQYDGHATVAAVKAEYRRRGWKVPKTTHWERGRAPNRWVAARMVWAGRKNDKLQGAKKHRGRGRR